MAGAADIASPASDAPEFGPPLAPLSMPVQSLSAVAPRSEASRLPPTTAAVLRLRCLALAGSTGFASAITLVVVDTATPALAALSACIMFLSVWWLSWGAAQAALGLAGPARPVPPGASPAGNSRCIVLIPICNEDPVATFARVAALQASLALTGEGARFDVAILSDTPDDAVAALERAWFLRLRAEGAGAGRLYYRRRPTNAGRKAGNIADFLRQSGAAWSFALVLDADSLIEGATVVEMARRLEADPRLGLLQTLPRLIRARSWFARAMQFSSQHYAPVFARGAAAMQGHAGPFWGHNAMLRIPAFAAACGLPVLPGRPPFGGPVLSHDHVEAALLVRAGWAVRLDADLEGTYEEGPATVIDHARRDRRWAQGNLQHIRIVAAAGLAPWSRFALLQGIFAYIVPAVWLAFPVLAVWGALGLALSDAGPPVPGAALPLPAGVPALVLVGLLVLPRMAIAGRIVRSGGAAGCGRLPGVARAVLGELAVSALVAPVLLLFQTRALVQILRGRDAGWPAQNREGGVTDWREAWQASRWISLTGAVAAVAVGAGAPALWPWLLPVVLPMLAAPVILRLLSCPAPPGVFPVPSETTLPPVIRQFERVLLRWRGLPPPAAPPAAFRAVRPPQVA